jgi:peptidoglycan hydrolase-like protein with peptidoglycan-binding domain
MMRWKITMAMALAGVMAAAPAFAASHSGVSKSSRAPKSTGQEHVKAAQQALKDKGHDPGSVDGRLGPRTQQALRDFQKTEGLEATGRLDEKTMQSLGIEGTRTSGVGESSPSASPSSGTGAAGRTNAAGQKK